MTARPPVSNELLRQLLVWFFVSFVCNEFIHFHSIIQSVSISISLSSLSSPLLFSPLFSSLFLLSTFSLYSLPSLPCLPLVHILSLVGSRRSCFILSIQPVPSSPEERLPTLGWYTLLCILDLLFYYFCHSLVCSARVDAVHKPC